MTVELHTIIVVHTGAWIAQLLTNSSVSSISDLCPLHYHKDSITQYGNGYWALVIATTKSELCVCVYSRSHLCSHSNTFHICRCDIVDVISKLVAFTLGGNHC